jgi:hypothetical protein
MTHLLVLAEFRCSEDGDAELRKQLDRTLEEVRRLRALDARSTRMVGAGPTTCRHCGRELAFDPGSAAAADGGEAR